MNMKKILHFVMITLLTCLSSLVAHAQSENALDFDGINDQVEAVNASSLISGSTQISIACWVYPRNAAPSFPDYDGIIGFRDNQYADFYLLQYTSSSVEARFTNSSGDQFNIVSQGLQLNTWQHYAMTYDGSYLRVYHNGLITDSVPASGAIYNSLQSFMVGNQVYQSTNYYLDGKLDEVGLWNRSLTAEEVMCLYKNKIDINSAGLQIYYDMNLGTAGGNNTSISVIPDRKLHINGVMSGFNLMGNSSNFISGIDNSTVITASLCVGQTYAYNGQFITQPGTYPFNLTSSVNCDSIVTLILTQNDTSVTAGANNLSAHQGGAVYQWINCTTNTPVAGAVNQTFAPTANGTYAVVITANGCSDTSSCHQFIISGINNLAQNNWTIYPNPATDNLLITSNHSVSNANIIIADISGKVIRKINSSISQQLLLDISELNKGIYQVTIQTETEIINLKFLKL